MKNNYKFLIFSFLSLYLFTPLTFCEVSDKEMKSFLEAIKEKKDEELIIASEQFKECETQFSDFREESSDETKKNFTDCLKKKILESDDPKEGDTKLLEIAKKLGLSSFNIEAAESSKSIMEYLQKRIRKTIYGTDDNKEKIKKLKEQKYTDHEVYYQLYSEQIGKNTLLEISKYCLENFGTDDPHEFMYIETIKDKSGKDVGGQIFISNPIQKITGLKAPPTEEERPFKEVFELIKDIDVQDPKTFTVELKRFDWKNTSSINEYEVCTLKNKKECDNRFKDSKTNNIKAYRTLHTIGLLRDAEFELSKNDSQKNLIKNRYNFCAGAVIKNMCEIYRCNNVYTDKTPEEERERCDKEFGIPVTSLNKTFGGKGTDKIEEGDLFTDKRNKKGAIACNLINRLEEYRAVLKGVKAIQDSGKNEPSDRVNISGGAIGVGFKDEFNSKEVDNLTSISSIELTENVDSLNNGEKNAEKLKEDCMEEDPTVKNKFTLKDGAKDDEKCSLLLAKLDNAKLETITLDTETKTIAKLKEIESLKTKEEIKKFLIENNMTQFEGRLSEIADDESKMNEMKNLISQNFNAKRLALIDRLKEKFKKESQIKKFKGENKNQKDINIDIENEIANQTIADIETHKQRVETLFQYSNIVSSYLEVKDKDENIVGQNITGRKAEIDNDKEGNLKLYFAGAEGDTSTSSSSGGSIEYIQALDQLIDFKSKDEKDKSNSP